MNTTTFHIPGLPKQPVPPSELKRAADSKAPEGVVQLGLTTTSDGVWALLARIEPHAHAPIVAVEQIAHGHPVIYQTITGRLPVARPAFPGLGE